MPASRRTNLSYRTRNAASQIYTIASQTDEQHEIFKYIQIFF
jgi:hypothetical protein